MLHVLTINGSRARLYEVTEGSATFREVLDFGNRVAKAHERDLVAARPGRVYHRSSGVHQTLDPAQKTKRLATMQWLKQTAVALDQVLRLRGSEGVVLIGHARLLAEFTRHLPPSLRNRIKLQIRRNLSGLPVLQLTRTVRPSLKRIGAAQAGARSPTMQGIRPGITAR